MEIDTLPRVRGGSGGGSPSYPYHTHPFSPLTVSTLKVLTQFCYSVYERETGNYGVSQIFHMTMYYFIFVKWNFVFNVRCLVTTHIGYN